MTSGNSIRAALVLLVTIVLAIWLGVSLVTQQLETLMWVGGVGMLLVCALLGRRIWLMLILLASLDVALLRGVGTQELGYALFVGFSVLMFLVRRLPMRWSFGELELWALLIGLVILQVYVRNPVGLNIMGASSVGGRPYFLAAIVFVVSFILRNFRVNPGDLKVAMWVSIAGGFAGVPLNILRLGGSGFLPQEGQSIEQSGRFKALSKPASQIAKIVVAFISPLKACFHPFWAPFVLLSFALAAASGFRSTVAYIGLIYLVGIAYRGGIASVAVSVLGGAAALGFLAIVNVVAPLPGNVQRALSPLPGTWERRHVRAGERSTEWRVEMWKLALTSDDYIQNKVLGDGLGMTEREMRQLQDLEARGRIGGMSGLTLQQEGMMLTGSYHSGPVQAIRVVGYVGLGVLLLAMIRLAVHAHRQIMRCRNTEYYGPALFFMIPIIVAPIFFTFVFGEFASALTGYLMGSAWVRIFEKNLPLPVWSPVSNRKYVPITVQRPLKPGVSD